MDFLKRMSIRTQLLLLAFFTMILVFLIILTIYSKTSEIITNKNKEYTAEMFLQIKQNVSTNCILIDNIITNIAYNPTVQDYLMEDNEVNRFDLSRKIDNIVSNMREIKSGIIEFIVFSDNGNTYEYGVSNGIKQVQMMEKSFLKLDKPYYSGLVSIRNGRDNGSANCLIAGNSVISIDPQNTSGERIGIAAAYVDASSLVMDEDVLSKSKSSDIYILDRDDNIIFCKDSALIGKKIEFLKDDEIKKGSFTKDIQGEKHIIQADDIPEIGGKIVSVVPMKAILSGLVELEKIVLIILLIALVALSIPFIMIINNIIHPVNKMMKFIKAIKSGNRNNLKKRIQLVGNSEMSIMALEFNGMLDEIDNLTHRLVDTTTMLYKSEIEKKQSEVAFLQSQINPHFLYNTLESISGMAIKNGIREINDIASSLGRIFRYSIKGADFVTFEEELDIVTSYVQIQQIRFANRFELKTDIDPATLKCNVLKMIMQPIVENAIYHGLEPKIDKGRLLISSRLTEGDTLEINIEDDGTGIEESSLESLRLELDDDRILHTLSSNASIGIYNVNNRLKLTFGSEFGIRIISNLNKGTRVVLTMPAGGNEDVQGTSGR